MWFDKNIIQTPYYTNNVLNKYPSPPPSLKELEVGGSAEDLTPEGRQALDAALQGNPTLRKLKFFDDPSYYHARSV